VVRVDKGGEFGIGVDATDLHGVVYAIENKKSQPIIVSFEHDDRIQPL
jgi:hypothetical protein